MPSFSANQKAAIESRAYYACDLIEMDFTNSILTEFFGGGTSLYLCTAYTDLELTTDTGTHTYVGGKNGLLTTPNVTQSSDNSKTTVDINLSALNLLYVATVQDATFINTNVRLYKAIFDADTADSNSSLTIIDSPVQMFKGNIVGASYNAGANDNTVTFNCHHWLFDDKSANGTITEEIAYKHWLEDNYSRYRTSNGLYNWMPSGVEKTPFQNMSQENFDVRWGQK